MNMLCTWTVERATMPIMLRFAFATLLAAVSACELYITDDAPAPDASTITAEPPHEPPPPACLGPACPDARAADTVGTPDALTATHPPFPEPVNCVGWGCDAGTP